MKKELLKPQMIIIERAFKPNGNKLIVLSERDIEFRDMTEVEKFRDQLQVRENSVVFFRYREKNDVLVDKNDKKNTKNDEKRHKLTAIVHRKQQYQRTQSKC